MITDLIASVVFGIVEVLFRAAVSRGRPAEPPRAIRDAMDEAAGEEHARLSAWAHDRGLGLRDDGVFAGALDGVSVALDPGCDGSSPRGAELAVAIAGLATTSLLVTERARHGTVVGELFDDASLDGALRSIAVTPEGLRLRFVPRCSPEVLDIALRLVREVEIAEPISAPRAGVYR